MGLRTATARDGRGRRLSLVAGEARGDTQRKLRRDNQRKLGDVREHAFFQKVDFQKLEDKVRVRARARARVSPLNPDPSLTPTLT